MAVALTKDPQATSNPPAALDIFSSDPACSYALPVSGTLSLCYFEQVCNPTAVAGIL
jgi:hypothetical protein